MLRLEYGPEKWISVFGKRSCSTRKIERDDDSKKSHLVLANALAIVVLASGALLACAGLSGMTIGGSGLGLLFVSVSAAEEVKLAAG
jgi:hypothetical protein